MFTANQIKEAHSKAKTGADYPRYVQTLKTMGVTHYEFLVADGSCVFYGDNGHQAEWEPKYQGLPIADVSSKESLKHAISIHQQGQTDFMTFCHQAADAGVIKWVTDLKKMVVEYLDRKGEILLSEPIPTGEYA